MRTASRHAACTRSVGPGGTPARSRPSENPSAFVNELAAWSGGHLHPPPSNVRWTRVPPQGTRPRGELLRVRLPHGVEVVPERQHDGRANAPSSAHGGPVASGTAGQETLPNSGC